MKDSYLREIRRKLGISQEELARMLNVSCATVNRWELGKNKPSRLALQNIDAFCRMKNLPTMTERGENRETP